MVNTANVMSSPRQIYSYLDNYFKKGTAKEKNFKTLVTAGPTRNFIKSISNESSGKQGYEIAIALSKLGIYKLNFLDAYLHEKNHLLTA